jgi:uncharacterized protein YutD
MICFQIPEFVKSKDGHVFHREEVLLISLYILSYLNNTNDAAFIELFGHVYIRVSKIVKTFLDYIVDNWSYILLHNGTFWKPYLQVNN